MRYALPCALALALGAAACLDLVRGAGPDGATFRANPHRTGAYRSAAVEGPVEVVWRTITEPGCVTLGELTQEKCSTPALVVERSMYGVVATPLGRGKFASPAKVPASADAEQPQ